MPYDIWPSLAKCVPATFVHEWPPFDERKTPRTRSAPALEASLASAYTIRESVGASASVVRPIRSAGGRPVVSWVHAVPPFVDR